MLSTILGISPCGYAQEPSEDISAQTAADLYRPQDGDTVFFEITSFKWDAVPKGEKVSIEILDQNDKSLCEYQAKDGKITKNSEFSVKRGGDETYHIKLSANRTTAVNDIFKTEGLKGIFTALDDNIKENPNDTTKWQFILKLSNGVEVTFRFRGIQRIYAIKSIDIPPESPLRYKNSNQTNAPVLLIYIRGRDGNCVSWKNGNPWFRDPFIKAPKGWSSQLATTGNRNRFIIREGIGAEYSINVFDEDGDDWAYDAPIVDFTEIPDYEFRNPEGITHRKCETIKFEQRD